MLMLTTAPRDGDSGLCIARGVESISACGTRVSSPSESRRPKLHGAGRKEALVDGGEAAADDSKERSDHQDIDRAEGATAGRGGADTGRKRARGQ